jgi:prepilin-type N-terminal cleavage/methylation domain-containing protein
MKHSPFSFSKRGPYAGRTNFYLRSKAGFTLVELLVVMGIIAIMAALAVPALSSISASADVNSSTMRISQLLSEARAYAMAHNSYTWVGFAEDATQNLSVALVGGTTGDLSDITSSSTYEMISPVQTFPHCQITTVEAVQQSNSLLTGLWANGSELTTTSSPGSFTVKAGGITFSDVLQFNPQGQANVLQVNPQGQANVGALPHWIQFGLQPIRGGNTTGKNVAAIQVAGLSGGVQVFRP